MTLFCRSLVEALGLSVLCVACGARSRAFSEESPLEIPDEEFVTEGTLHPGELPEVLIIGDSISIGYTPPLQSALSELAVVSHIGENAHESRNGVQKLDTWLGDRLWDVIHFNHGLHDLKWVDEGERAHINVPVEEYEANLRVIVRRLEETGAVVIFATTTPVPDVDKRVRRDAADVPKYNAAALRVMDEYGVEVDDLYGFALSRLSEIQRPNDVHFTEAGYEVLAEKVSESIRIHLSD